LAECFYAVMPGERRRRRSDCSNAAVEKMQSPKWRRANRQAWQ
jgi:hypothetical protein